MRSRYLPPTRGTILLSRDAWILEIIFFTCVRFALRSTISAFLWTVIKPACLYEKARTWCVSSCVQSYKSVWHWPCGEDFGRRESMNLPALYAHKVYTLNFIRLFLLGWTWYMYELRFVHGRHLQDALFVALSFIIMCLRNNNVPCVR